LGEGKPRFGQADCFAGEDDDVSELESEVVVGLVGADPKPVKLAIPFPGDRAVAATYLGGVDASFFLEA
jgi:hypothetical protein